MKKIIFILSILLYSFMSYAQIGIGNTNPRGALDINMLNGKNKMGLVLPAVDGVGLDSIGGVGYPIITTPNSAFQIVSETDDENNIQYFQVPNDEAPEGTLVFDVGLQCMRVKQSSTLGDWSDCLLDRKLAEKEIEYKLRGGENFKMLKASAGSNLSVAIGAGNKYVYTAGKGQAYRTGKGITGNTRWGNIPIISKPAVDVSAGYQHGLAALEDGTVWSWGVNSYARTGLGTTSSYTKTPRQITMPTTAKVVQVQASNLNSLVLTEDGEVYAFGSNTKYLNGLNIASGNALTPTKVPFPAGVKIKKISLAFRVAAALSTTGDVYAWGENVYGNTGQGKTAGYTQVPTLMSTSVKFKDMSIGSRSFIALSINDEIYVCGQKYATGQGASGTITVPTLATAASLPTFDDGEVINGVAARNGVIDDTCYGTMIFTNKTVYAASGNNTGAYYTLGIFDSTTGNPINSAAAFVEIQNHTIYSGTNFVMASLGRFHSFLTTRNSQTELYNNLVYGAGYNPSFPLSTGPTWIRLYSASKK